MKKRFALTLVDLSPRMLALSRTLNPECEHVRGDMRVLRLGREFDAVFVHDAVVYMTTRADLRKAIGTAYAHCRPGGAAVFQPDYTRETFRPGTKCGGHDGEDGRSLRYLEWVHDLPRSGTTYEVDYAYTLRDRRGRTRVMHDRHIEGVFSRNEWLAMLRDAGFRARAVPWPNRLYPTPPFVAKRPK
jgi:hypothetical protein